MMCTFTLELEVLVHFPVINHVIIASLLWLNIFHVLANFLISSDTTIYKYFSFYEGNLVSANDPIMTQNYVTVSIELCH